jgi:hypothetical protein
VICRICTTFSSVPPDLLLLLVPTYSQVTEKVLRPWRVGNVPIYYGSKSVADWAPDSHSYINVRDFMPDGGGNGNGKGSDVTTRSNTREDLVAAAEKVALLLNNLNKDDGRYVPYLQFKQGNIGRSSASSAIATATTSRYYSSITTPSLLARAPAPAGGYQWPHYLEKDAALDVCLLCDKVADDTKTGKKVLLESTFMQCAAPAEPSSGSLVTGDVVRFGAQARRVRGVMWDKQP